MGTVKEALLPIIKKSTMQLLSLLLLAVVAMVGAWETDLEALRFIINAEDLECSNAADKPRACCVMCMKKAPSKPEKSLVKYPDDPLKSDEYHLGWKYWPTMTGDRPFTDPPPRLRAPTPRTSLMPTLLESL